MNVFLNGKKVVLDKHSFVGQGGEGEVYVKNGFAYKVYFDSSRMIPLGKIQELSVLTDKHIIRPIDVLKDSSGKSVGYTMLFVKKGIPICQIFPRSYRERTGIKPEDILDIVKKLKEIVVSCHSGNVLIVDLNEMNFLLDENSDLFAIDADSYQTKSYDATAIMESIRDWQTKGFSTLSDWFSFGIISFQLFTGLHPFRGKYKGSLNEFKNKLPTDAVDDSFAITRRRMKNNISVYHPEVGIPQSAYPLSVIPTSYDQWYRSLFVDGKRMAPPDALQATINIVPMVKAILGTNKLKIDEIRTYDGNILGVWTSFEKLIVKTTKSVWIDDYIVPSLPWNIDCVCFSALQQKPVAISSSKNVEIMNLESNNRNSTSLGLEVDGKMSYSGRLYVKNIDKILEVDFRDLSGRIVCSSTLAASVMEHATYIGQGVIIQNLLGSMYVTVFPESGVSQQIKMEELDKFRIIEAKFDKQVLMVIAENNGKYSRYIFRFPLDFKAYDTRIIKDIPLVGLNFVTLDSGVVVSFNEDENIEIFSVKKGSTTINEITDPVLSGDMHLAEYKGKLIFYRGNKVYRMSMV